MNKCILLVLLAVGVAFAGCKRDYDPVPSHVELVYPIEDGKYRIYHVIDTSYASAQGIDALTYYKMERTDGTEEDLLGRETSRLWLYTSPDTLGTPENPEYQWTFSELWTQYVDDKYAERIEGNTRYLVLKMPPYEGSSWNGNLFNNGDVQTYTYLNIDTTVTVQGETFDNCVYVEQVPFRMPVPNDSGAVFFLIEHAYEIYAPNVGKIVRYCKYYVEQQGVAESDSKVYFEELVDHNYE